MNEKSNATSRFRFLNIPPTIVAPLLLIPGSNANTWNIPIVNASFSVISFDCFIPLKSFIMNRNIDVIRSVRPTNFTFSSKKSNSPNFSTIGPTIPAGIVAIIMYQLYL